MITQVFRWFPVSIAALAMALALTACDSGTDSPANTSAPDIPRPQAGSPTADAGRGATPDTSAMGPIVLGKINVHPAVDGKATLVEFRQKSVSTEKLGDSMMSAVVEFEGVVTFSGDVQWSWQGPTKAGEPQKFEARAEYFNEGKGWQLVQPLGIYPL